MSDEARRDLKGASINLLTILAQAALPAFHVQLARTLGGSRYGLYSWANSFVDMLSVITLLGMDVALSREVSEAHASGDHGRALRATATALRVVFLSGVAVAVGVGVMAPTIARIQHKPDLVTPLRTLVLLPVGFHLATVFLTALQARRVMVPDFWTRGIAQPLSVFALTTLVLRLHGGLPSACLAVAVGMSFTAIISALFYGKELSLRDTLSRAAFAPTDWPMVRMGLPLVATNLIFAVQGKLDAFFLGYHLSSEEVGAYGACVLYVVSLSQVRSAFYPGVCATVPAGLRANDTVGLNRFLRRQTRWVALLAAPLFVLFAGFGDGLLSVFDAHFARASSALAILAIGHLSSALSVAPYALLLSPYARLTFFTGSFSVIAQCVLLPTLIPRFGLAGAAASTATVLCLLNGAQNVITWRVLGLHGLSWGLAKVLFAASLGFAAGRALFVGLPYSLAPRFFAGVGVAAVVYVLAVVVLGLDADEKALVRDGWRKLTRTKSDNAGP